MLHTTINVNVVLEYTTSEPPGVKTLLDIYKYTQGQQGVTISKTCDIISQLMSKQQQQPRIELCNNKTTVYIFAM